MKAEVYFHSKKKIFSIRVNGRVVDHRLSLCMRDVVFKVSESGRQRVLREKKKNVHALVVGEIVESCKARDEVKYNPYRSATFVTLDGSPIFSADYVRLDVVDKKSKIFAARR
jgi:ribosomal protein S4